MNHLTFSSVEAVGEMPDVEVEKVRSVFENPSTKNSNDRFFRILFNKRQLIRLDGRPDGLSTLT